MLETKNLKVAYGSITAIHDLSISVPKGSIVTLIGANGAGKSTTLRAISGILRSSGGSIHFEGEDITHLPPHKIVERGLSQVPEGRMIFPNLTVYENLVATAVKRDGGAWSLEKVYELFPRLAERAANMGNQLSGGEQQMLAVGRALMTNPRLLILDEATEGLAPLIRAEIWRCLARLKSLGLSILVIDKNVGALVQVADRHFLIERGRVVWSGASRELAAAPDVQHRYLGI